MKTQLSKIIISVISISTSISLYASSPPPPPGEHGLSGEQCTTSGAPLESGLLILLGLATAYAGRILYRSMKERRKQNQLQ